MKNQYFGDINDYRKYGLLRILTACGKVRLSICWMLTEDDSRPDGSSIGYLNKPRKYRGFDPLLYDAIREIVSNNRTRNVKAAKQENILPSATFYTRMTPDDRFKRSDYFQDFLKRADGSQLIFFDPDNGLEVKSKPYGRKDCSKYLFWHELMQAYAHKHSVLVYQHFPHVQRDDFIREKTQEIGLKTGAPEVLTYRTPHVVFFLIPQKSQINFFNKKSIIVTAAWNSQIEIQRHIIIRK